MHKATQRFRDWACTARWKARVAVSVALLLGVPFTFAEYTFLAVAGAWGSWAEDIAPVIEDARTVLRTGKMFNG